MEERFTILRGRVGFRLGGFVASDHAGVDEGNYLYRDLQRGAVAGRFEIQRVQRNRQTLAALGAASLSLEIPQFFGMIT